jgi:hypothetical protein
MLSWIGMMGLVVLPCCQYSAVGYYQLAVPKHTVQQACQHDQAHGMIPISFLRAALLIASVILENTRTLRSALSSSARRWQCGRQSARAEYLTRFWWHSRMPVARQGVYAWSTGVGQAAAGHLSARKLDRRPMAMAHRTDSTHCADTGGIRERAAG